MATIKPFRAIRYSASAGRDLSEYIAPPYDVLDGAGKSKLLAKSPFNIVKVDLPFVPPKTLGPQAVYDEAAATLQQWIASGILHQDARACLYPYEQTYTHNAHEHKRRGLIALVKLTPFGVDVIPHEKTYAGPIEDRLRLMHSTLAQLSPVFGLYYDDGDAIAKSLFGRVALPNVEATLDGVRSRLWTEFDAEVEVKVMDGFKDKKIYIADGHHRYTTALHYQKQMIEKNGGKELPADHPANFCMMVLVNAADPGLLILPTHRLIGGLSGWDLEAFLKHVEPWFDVTRIAIEPSGVANFIQKLDTRGPNAIGVFDGASQTTALIKLKDASRMKTLEPKQSNAWRSLDVAILQRAILDEVIAKHFSKPDAEPTRGYTAYENEVVPKVDGKDYQVGFLLQPTPIRALEQLGNVGEVMPQKSTFFFPKLATGLTIAPLA